MNGLKKRILIVEDERDVAMLLHEYLENENYEIQEVHSGAEALGRIFSGSGFDLVLLDYGMRDIKGDRVCELVRNDEKTKQLPVLIVTAHVEMDEKIFRDYGATDVLYKPVDSHELIEKIKKYLVKK